MAAERAADSLKTRIEARIVSRGELGPSFLDRLNGNLLDPCGPSSPTSMFWTTS